MEEEIPVNTDVQKPEEECLKEIVDLVDVPKAQDAPIDLRESRRRTRRRLLDEVDDLDQPMRPKFQPLRVSQKKSQSRKRYPTLNGLRYGSPKSC